MSLTEEKRHEIAREVSDYWKVNCTDDDFYDNCRENVELEVDENLSDDEYYVECNKIMDLIENIYRHDNWEARELFKEKNKIMVKFRNVIINGMLFRTNVLYIELFGHIVHLCNYKGNTISEIDINKIESIEIVDRKKIMEDRLRGD